jgi:hypothetical protein
MLCVRSCPAAVPKIAQSYVVDLVK